MIDWMVEVLTTFKASEQCFFTAVTLMDRYFKKTDFILGSSDLHLIGVTTMFIASKYEDVVQFSLETIVQKVGHSKFSKQQIID